MGIDRRARGLLSPVFATFSWSWFTCYSNYASPITRCYRFNCYCFGLPEYASVIIGLTFLHLQDSWINYFHG